MIALSLIAISYPSHTSTPLQASLEELASAADHILIGRVVAVDMIDGNGQQVLDENGITGPGLDNIIRLHITIDETLVTNASPVPELLKVPLDPFMHYSLGQIRDAHSEISEPLLILLEGSKFQPIVPGVFMRRLDDKSEALRIHANSKGE